MDRSKSIKKPEVIELRKWKINARGLAARLKLREGSSAFAEFEAMVKEAVSVARPKAVYSAEPVEGVNGDSLFIGSVEFKSRVLRINCSWAGTVFPFIATCGIELEKWSEARCGLIQSLWADEIKTGALDQAVSILHDDIRRRYGLEKIAAMNPGSLEDWPISEQKKLFSVLGGAHEMIDVELKESMMMSPSKTVSGIIFRSDSGFVNCMLCIRDGCPRRRSAYDERLKDWYANN